jgi:rhamnose transport system ATP-binding protein
LISSDLPEVLAMSDRVLVMREGRQMGVFSRDEATQERIIMAAMGQEAITAMPSQSTTAEQAVQP